MPITLHVNGKQYRLQIDPRVTLLDCLRENLNLPGTKKGCDHGQCGACTVHVNGRRVNSCLSFAVMHINDQITTIEGLGPPDHLHPMQAAFVEHDGFQCGYCTSGQIMSAVALLKEPWDPAMKTSSRACMETSAAAAPIRTSWQPFNRFANNRRHKVVERILWKYFSS